MSSFKENLVKARGGIFFLVGLSIATAMVYALEFWEQPVITAQPAPLIEPRSNYQTVSLQRDLTNEELEWAKIAWTYFENNYHAETGLVNSVDEYPASTLWDTSSYLLGLIAAYRLEIVEADEFYIRVNALLDTLATLELFDSLLPNKSYNTQTVDMVTYDNEVSERGIGWSAIDIGRFMVPINVLVWQYPEFTSKIAKVVKHWDLSAMVVDAELMGTDLDSDGNTEYVQEGRLGYEEYASKSMVLIGYDVSKALDYELYLGFEDILGVEIGVDQRSPDEFGALNYVVSEPYILDGLEFGWDRYSRELANRLYKVQLKRYEDTGYLTAVSEDNIDQAPYFVYNTVFADGKKWNATTENREDASDYKTLSTKAVFGWHVLFNTEYTQLMVDKIKDNYDPERGWYSGIYEATDLPNKAITANTNGIILEALHYLKFGSFVKQAVNSNSTVASID